MYGVDAASRMGWNNGGFETQARNLMIHRHLNHQELSLAAIDDVISRGKRKDWEDLRLAVLDNPRVPGKNTTGMPRPYRQSARPTLPFLDALCRRTSRCLIGNKFFPRRLSHMLPDAVVSGTRFHAQHRFSRDADHVLPGLRGHFDEILAQLESVAGCKTARVQRPVQILGSLDGIETGVRQLIREQPLETTVVNYAGQAITVPTKEEILRIKGALILKRNATRDYLDFVALADQLGGEKTAAALSDFDRLYPRPTTNRRCSNCRFNSPTRFPTIWRKRGWPNTKTLPPNGRIGTQSKPRATAVPQPSLTASPALEQKRHQKKPRALE